MSDDGAGHGAGDGIVDDFPHARLAHLAEILAHPVKHHHRLVHGVAQHRQHRRQHGQVEFPLEEGEEAENDHHVVHVGDDGRHRKTPFEAQREVSHDADRNQQQGQRAIIVQLLADLRTDELDPADLDRGILLFQDIKHILGQLGAAHPLLDRQADQHIAAGAEILYCRILEADAVDRRADLADIRRLRVIDFHHRAAGEIHPQREAFGCQEKDGEDEGQERDGRCYTTIAHERDVFLDAEQFHEFSLRCLSRSSACRSCDDSRKTD
ncbi:hypothetical protein GALL_348440 [mine drainage metagenome]|uniref:Uncharacterized protein n=1 Tax=mine drainage metagenome TaxID=410659 RepID=A0A1J5QU05_9ZZZZ